MVSPSLLPFLSLLFISATTTVPRHGLSLSSPLSITSVYFSHNDGTTTWSLPLFSPFSHFCLFQPQRRYHDMVSPSLLPFLSLLFISATTTVPRHGLSLSSPLSLTSVYFSHNDGTTTWSLPLFSPFSHFCLFQPQRRYHDMVSPSLLPFLSLLFISATTTVPRHGLSLSSPLSLTSVYFSHNDGTTTWSLPLFSPFSHFCLFQPQRRYHDMVSPSLLPFLSLLFISATTTVPRHGLSLSSPLSLTSVYFSHNDGTTTWSLPLFSPFYHFCLFQPQRRYHDMVSPSLLPFLSLLFISATTTVPRHGLSLSSPLSLTSVYFSHNDGTTTWSLPLFSPFSHFCLFQPQRRYHDMVSPSLLPFLSLLFISATTTVPRHGLSLSSPLSLTSVYFSHNDGTTTWSLPLFSPFSHFCLFQPQRRYHDMVSPSLLPFLSLLFISATTTVPRHGLSLSSPLSLTSVYFSHNDGTTTWSLPLFSPFSHFCLFQPQRRYHDMVSPSLLPFLSLLFISATTTVPRHGLSLSSPLSLTSVYFSHNDGTTTWSLPLFSPFSHFCLFQPQRRYHDMVSPSLLPFLSLLFISATTTVPRHGLSLSSPLSLTSVYFSHNDGTTTWSLPLFSPFSHFCLFQPQRRYHDMVSPSFLPFLSLLFISATTTVPRHGLSLSSPLSLTSVYFSHNDGTTTWSLPLFSPFYHFCLFQPQRRYHDMVAPSLLPFLSLLFISATTTVPRHGLSLSSPLSLTSVYFSHNDGTTTWSLPLFSPFSHFCLFQPQRRYHDMVSPSLLPFLSLLFISATTTVPRHGLSLSSPLSLTSVYFSHNDGTTTWSLPLFSPFSHFCLFQPQRRYHDMVSPSLLPFLSLLFISATTTVPRHGLSLSSPLSLTSVYFSHNDGTTTWSLPLFSPFYHFCLFQPQRRYHDMVSPSLLPFLSLLFISATTTVPRHGLSLSSPLSLTSLYFSHNDGTTTWSLPLFSPFSHFCLFQPQRRYHDMVSPSLLPFLSLLFISATTTVPRHGLSLSSPLSLTSVYFSHNDGTTTWSLPLFSPFYHFCLFQPQRRYHDMVAPSLLPFLSLLFISATTTVPRHGLSLSSPLSLTSVYFSHNDGTTTWSLPLFSPFSHFSLFQPQRRYHDMVSPSLLPFLSLLFISATTTVPRHGQTRDWLLYSTIVLKLASLAVREIFFQSYLSKIFFYPYLF